MRELKFRAWANLNEYNTRYEDNFRYYYPDDIVFLLDGEGLLQDTEDCEARGAISPNHCIIEQYTGLKDKNGKEIYEGDIVKVARSYGYGFLPKGAKAKIEFDEKELCYKLRGQGEFRLTVKKEVEVIGNIHENPELLKGGER